MQTNRLNHTAKRMKAIAKAQGSDLQREANRKTNKEAMTAYCKLAQRMGLGQEVEDAPDQSVHDGNPQLEQPPQLESQQGEACETRGELAQEEPPGIACGTVLRQRKQHPPQHMW